MCRCDEEGMKLAWGISRHAPASQRHQARPAVLGLLARKPEPVDNEGRNAVHACQLGWIALERFLRPLRLSNPVDDESPGGEGAGNCRQRPPPEPLRYLDVGLEADSTGFQSRSPSSGAPRPTRTEQPAGRRTASCASSQDAYRSDTRRPRKLLFPGAHQVSSRTIDRAC